jgi:hypothetical protein
MSGPPRQPPDPENLEELGDLVELEGEESFPASDSPGSWAGSDLGPAGRRAARSAPLEPPPGAPEREE